MVDTPKGIGRLDDVDVGGIFNIADFQDLLQQLNDTPIGVVDPIDMIVQHDCFSSLEHYFAENEKISFDIHPELLDRYRFHLKEGVKRRIIGSEWEKALASEIGEQYAVAFDMAEKLDLVKAELVNDSKDESRPESFRALCAKEAQMVGCLKELATARITERVFHGLQEQRLDGYEWDDNEKIEFLGGVIGASIGAWTKATNGRRPFVYPRIEEVSAGGLVSAIQNTPFELSARIQDVADNLAYGRFH